MEIQSDPCDYHQDIGTLFYCLVGALGGDREVREEWVWSKCILLMHEVLKEVELSTGYVIDSHNYVIEW